MKAVQVNRVLFFVMSILSILGVCFVVLAMLFLMSPPINSLEHPDKPGLTVDGSPVNPQK